MSGEPTLRHGDREKDGWVKYAQELLNTHNEHMIAPDGYFGDETQSAVRKFQRAKHLQVDGTIGDQTWAALRGEAPAAPASDGLAPHTHVDQGLHAVWNMENTSDDGHYRETLDDVIWLATNVGSQPIKSGQYMASAELTVNGQTHIEFFELKSVFEEDDVPPGNSLVGGISGVKATYGSGTHAYVVQLPAELGNAERRGEFTVP